MHGLPVFSPDWGDCAVEEVLKSQTPSWSQSVNVLFGFLVNEKLKENQSKDISCFLVKWELKGNQRELDISCFLLRIKGEPKQIKHKLFPG